jgi:hypothetical protein
MNDNISELESMLGSKETFDNLERAFDQYCPEFDSYRTNEDLLRSIKSYLSKEKDEINRMMKGTLLLGSDCLTRAVLAAILYNRKGHNVEVVRPKDIFHYCHAMLLYEEGDKKRIFKVTGKSKPKRYNVLNNRQIVRRLKIIKPVVDFVNHYILHKY